MSTNSGSPLRINPVAYAVSVALTGSYAPAVLAQDQPQATDLDAVIVTARKREETLLDIPQEIQAISQEQLQKANLNSRRGLRPLRAEPLLHRDDTGPRHDLLPRRRGRLRRRSSPTPRPRSTSTSSR